MQVAYWALPSFIIGSAGFMVADAFILASRLALARALRSSRLAWRSAEVVVLRFLVFMLVAGEAAEPP